jgi:hypothetical protein
MLSIGERANADPATNWTNFGRQIDDNKDNQNAKSSIFSKHEFALNRKISKALQFEKQDLPRSLTVAGMTIDRNEE